MPGQYIKRYQVQVYKRAREAGCSQKNSAHIAAISERSGSRIEQGAHQPKSQGNRTWRTREDPLAGVWEQELEPMLRREPRLEARTLYEHLVEQHPGQYEQTLRTVQRRVQAWKAIYGGAKEVMFELRHEPGEMGLSDFTEVKGISITIGGKAYEHLLYHYRLAYSGWQYVQVIEGGESFIGLSEGLQNALSACGGVPKQHRTDSLSAAYRNMAGKGSKPLTRFYQELCEHYGLQPTRNNIGIAHENGAIESSHGHFKRRLRQALYLRGSFDFDTVEAYGHFLEQVSAKLNEQCQEKFTVEQQHLQPLPKYRYADYEEVTVRVSCHSTIAVRCILYSVPSRLIGRQLTVRLYHNRLVGYLGQQQVVQLPRVRVPGSAKIRRARCINYRHVIDSLRRKPRAFLYCSWQQELLPDEQWRALWQQMQEQFEPDKAARLMVEALYLAAKVDRESAVAHYLEQQLQQHSLHLNGLQKQFQGLAESRFPQLTLHQHDLAPYDQLLPGQQDTPSEQQCPPEPESVAQAPAPVPSPAPLANLGAASHSATLVLRPVLASTLRIGGGASLSGAHQTRPKRSKAPHWKKLF